MKNNYFSLLGPDLIEPNQCDKRPNLEIPLEQFDISLYDSAALNNETPEFLLSKLVLPFENFINTSVSLESRESTELKLRAILNTLVHEGLRQRASSKAQMETSIVIMLPQLDNVRLERKHCFDVAILQKKLVIFAPKLEQSNAISAFTNKLACLLDRPHGAKTWILDLSLVSKIPFELFGYLIGLKHILSRFEIELDLLWLRNDAVPSDLLESIQENFNLFSKGAFLISK